MLSDRPVRKGTISAPCSKRCHLASELFYLLFRFAALLNYIFLKRFMSHYIVITFILLKCYVALSSHSLYITKMLGALRCLCPLSINYFRKNVLKLIINFSSFLSFSLSHSLECMQCYKPKSEIKKIRSLDGTFLIQSL